MRTRSSRALALAVAVLLTTSVAAAAATIADRPAPSGQPAGHPARTPAGASAAPAGAPVIFRLPRTPTPRQPLRVLVIGDSVMQDTEPALAALFHATGAVRVTSLAAPWWGLTTASTWPQIWPRVIAQTRPEVVIGTWSWDLARAAADPASYSLLVDRALSVLLAPGDGVDGVVFLSFPSIGPHPGFDVAELAYVEAARQSWNRIMAAVAASRPARVSYLPVAGALDAAGGRYARWLPGPGGKWGRVRMVDEVHPCPTGAARLALAIDRDVATAWHLPLAAPGWWRASWVHDPLYNMPPGSCPDDGPPPGYQP